MLGIIHMRREWNKVDMVAEERVIRRAGMKKRGCRCDIARI